MNFFKFEVSSLRFFNIFFKIFHASPPFLRDCRHSLHFPQKKRKKKSKKIVIEIRMAYQFQVTYYPLHSIEAISHTHQI